ncbi:MAG TPA: hypothetical protein DCQ28_12440 [Bacteroidetes bacterium]|nr:hypothetical protein [Bacteroidota bacterium]
MAKPWKIPELNPEESLKQCVAKIALTRFQETFSYEQATTIGEDPEGLHDMRVAARRMRAVLKIFHSCFSKKKIKKYDSLFQTLVRTLGAVRESDVFLDSLISYKKTVELRDQKIIDLLIAREMSSRIVYRKKLLNELKLISNNKHPDSFVPFLKKTH